MSARGATEPVALDRAFFERPLLVVTRELLGCRLVRRDAHGALRVGRLVEVEAYGGYGDPSAHSHKGPTPRCQTMFGPAGHAYVYATQGRCCCMNVTVEGGERGRAVLLRAVGPLAGADAMRAARLERLGVGSPTRRHLLAGHDHELARGPGRLCLCFGVDRSWDGVDLTDGSGLLFLAGRGSCEADVTPSRRPRRRDDAVRRARPASRARAAGSSRAHEPSRVLWTPRVGLNAASASFAWRWRAVDRDSRAVSTGGARAEGASARPSPPRPPQGVTGD